MAPPTQVRCVNCSLLALYAPKYRGQSPYYETCESRRESGDVFRQPDDVSGNGNAEPVCMAREVRFRELMGFSPSARPDYTYDGTSPDHEKYTSIALAVLQSDRQCRWWINYFPGMEPSKMLEVAMFEQLGERLHAQSTAFLKELEDQSSKSARQHHRETLILGLFSLAAAVALGVAQIVVAYRISSPTAAPSRVSDTVPALLPPP